MYKGGTNMKTNDCDNESTSFVQNVMKKIQPISEYTKNGNTELIELYYQEHGTYDGVEEWLKSLKNYDSD